MKVERKLSTRADREYWAAVEKVGEEVKAMPKWMKGGTTKRKSGADK